MRTHVDWVTFTMPMIYGIDTQDAYANAIKRGFHDMFGEQLTADAFGGKWMKNEHGRAPYIDGWKLEGKGITLFASPTLSHCCVECSGEGCEALIVLDLLTMVLDSAKQRITRIDVACDIETDVMPLAFVSETNHVRMRTSGHYVSATGETCYVGSQKSERFARVYRYNSPHPRSNLLRVEHVFRKDYAKKVVQLYLKNGSNAISTSAGIAFGWSHAVWKPKEDIGETISIVNDNHKGNNSVFWLVNQVAPAFKRLVSEGVIKDQEQFFIRYFYSEQ